MNILKITLLLGWFLLTSNVLASDDTVPRSKADAKADANSAVVSLLNEAKAQFEIGQSEQAASLLERALRIDPRNPILWHNLAGVRLSQEDWARAANLAAKSNAFAVDNKWLRVRNWTLIALACEGMRDKDCSREARKRARALAG